jgi:LPS export ABC transporter permease LptG
VGAVDGIALLTWRARSADQPMRLGVPSWLRRRAAAAAAHRRTLPAPVRRVRLVIRIPHFDLPKPRLLDVYISREYLRILFLGIGGLLGLFYISTFIDLVDKLLRGETTGAMLLSFFYYATPQFVYYVIPMSVLIAALIAVGVLTKNSELLVMRACGISLYRTAAPLLFFGLVASGVLFFMQERVLVTANREADRLQRAIRRWPAATTALSRRWMIGTNGEVYHYDFFEQDTNHFTSLLVYRLDEPAWRLKSVTRANDAVFAPQAGRDLAASWSGRHGWTREFATPARGGTTTVTYTPFAERQMTLEAPEYFKTDEPLADLMTYGELRDYILRLNASGANVTPQRVALERKVAFPFVTVIMTILAVPFAVMTGRHGAMYGIGIGIGLAIVYILALSISGALGAGGVLSPPLAAWTPNIMFGAVALYLVLAVRT